MWAKTSNLLSEFTSRLSIPTAIGPEIKIFPVLSVTLSFPVPIVVWVVCVHSMGVRARGLGTAAPKSGKPLFFEQSVFFQDRSQQPRVKKFLYLLKEKKRTSLSLAVCYVCYVLMYYTVIFAQFVQISLSLVMFIFFSFFYSLFIINMYLLPYGE